MDPVTAKGLGGLGGLGGKLPTEMRTKGAPGKFEATRVDKLGAGKQFDAEKVAANFFESGKVEGKQAPSMAERVAMRDGISFQNVNGTIPVQGAEQAWRPNQVQASGKTESVAGAIKDLNSGQERLDGIIDQLRSGRNFSQAELIGLQAEVHVLSEQIQMSTKLVDSAMQSLKQVMQQQA